MPSRKLDEKTLKGLPTPTIGRIEYWDLVLPGFGLRITANDARSWFVKYRSPTVKGNNGRGVERRVTLGTVGMLTLAEARAEARKIFEAIQRGDDPALRVAPAAPAAPPKVPTVRDVAEIYLARHVEKNLRPGSRREISRMMRADILPAIGDRRPDDVTRHDIEALIDLVAHGRTRGPAEIQSNRVLTRIRAFFNWMIEQDLVSASPAERIRPRFKERSRDRALSDREIRWFWRACDRLGEPFGPLFQLLLLTGQRRDEVSGMEWAELDLPARLWTIPRERAKNDRAHDVALSELAFEILAGVSRFAEPGRFIFSTTGRTPVSGFSKAKAQLDAAMAEIAKEETGAAVSIEPFVLHDLRRTAATGMARLNIAPHVVDRILNHVSGTIRGVAAIYNRHQYADDRRAALEAWATRVKKII